MPLGLSWANAASRANTVSTIWTPTSVMVVVSNPPPLSNLAIIGRLDLLREQLGSVTIPPGVRIELSRHPIPDARELLERAPEDRWLLVVLRAGAVPCRSRIGVGRGRGVSGGLGLGDQGGNGPPW